MTNRNFKVTLSQENYVLRIPGNGTEGMVERRNEEINTLLSYRLGISPEISILMKQQVSSLPNLSKVLKH